MCWEDHMFDTILRKKFYKSEIFHNYLLELKIKGISILKIKPKYQLKVWMRT